MPIRQQNRGKRLPTRIGIGLLGLAMLATAACQSTAVDSAGSDGFGHVHGIAVNPGDGRLYVATHHGVFRVSAAEPAKRVGNGKQDTMGFAIAGADRFLASGHPAPGEGGPAHLGLIESTDAGHNWRTLSLAGKADFHALRVAQGIVYGLDSTTASLMASTDRVNWQVRSTVETNDLAVDPGRAETLLAATDQGVRRSGDGGRTWSSASGPALRLLHWSEPTQLWAVAPDGQILRSTDGGAAWSTTGGRVPNAPAAFTVDGGTMYVATEDAKLLRSTDTGATWQAM
ncbi:hypothetical protein GCM10027290_51050 [Micromonospora sonneratiae]|uniref:F510_1955 family glycosylhydrolase n=1 Tax=Micromonospora sonneratiae TaxID=1184706 RepID=A0ABW3Y6E4_9ACTN